MLVENLKANRLEFSDVKYGEVFYCNYQWWIKIVSPVGTDINCVNLKTGDTGYVDFQEITKIGKAKLVEIP